MDLPAVAARLLELRQKIAMEHGTSCDLKTLFLIKFDGKIPVQIVGLADGVGEIILEANRAGAFRHSYFTDLRAALLAAQRDYDATMTVLNFLSNRGFNVFGVDPSADPWERIAYAFESIHKELEFTPRQLAILTILRNLSVGQCLQAKAIYAQLPEPIRKDCTVGTLIRHDIPTLKKHSFIKQIRGRGYCMSPNAA